MVCDNYSSQSPVGTVTELGTVPSDLQVLTHSKSSQQPTRWRLPCAHFTDEQLCVVRLNNSRNITLAEFALLAWQFGAIGFTATKQYLGGSCSSPSPPLQEGVPPKGRVVLQRLTLELSGHGWQSWEWQSSWPGAGSSRPAAGNTALSPTCGYQLDGIRERGQLLSSHSKWNCVSVGVGVGGRELGFQSACHHRAP